MRNGWILVSLLFLAGCTPRHISPTNRAEWQQRHIRYVDGVTEEQLLSASEKVLKLADHDFTFDYPDHQLVATRRWSIYAVLAVTMGVDYWKITTEKDGDRLKVTLEISRQAGAITPSPVVGLNGGGQGISGISASQSMLPGQSVQGAFPYNLFWDRLGYILGKNSHWTTCKDAKYGKDRDSKWDSDTLCSVTTDDTTP